MLLLNKYQDMDEKYIRDKQRFLDSVKAMKDSLAALKSRKERAQKEGLTYICVDSDKSHSSWYELPCGHVKRIGIGDFYKKVFHCYGCQVQKWEADAKKNGLTFIQRTDGDRAEYEINACGHRIQLGMHHLKIIQKRFCEACWINDLTREAAENGLKFLHKAEKEPRKAVYQFLSCGHIQTLYTAHVKRKMISCHSCNATLRKRLETTQKNKEKPVNWDEQYKQSLSAQAGRPSSIAKWTAEAEGKGLTFLCKDVFTPNYGWYRLSCGHVRRIVVSNVRFAKEGSNFVCPICLEASRKQQAEEKGMLFLQAIDGDKGLYQFQKCRHTQEVYMEDVERHNAIHCKKCVMDKWEEEATHAGLVLIERKEKRTALYECQTCGTRSTFYVVAVRNQEFTCSGCQ